MSYSHNKRKKNISKFNKNIMSRISGIMVNEEKKTFKKINGTWKLVDYIEPMTSSK